MYRRPLSFPCIHGKGRIGDCVRSLLRTDSHERKQQKLPMDLELGDGIIGDGVRKRVDPGLGSSGKQSPEKEQANQRKKFLHGLPVMFVVQTENNTGREHCQVRVYSAMLFAIAAIPRQFDSSSKLAVRMQT
jgi:hypothetical protein